MTLRKPPALLPGDQVGIVAPASPFDRDRFFKGLDIIRLMGFNPVFADTLFSRNGYFAGTENQRREAIHQFFKAPDIKALWSVRGGYGSLRLLQGLDYSLIRRNPKIFIGCSDITALLVTLYAECSMVTFHGPMVSSLCEAGEETIEGVKQALTARQPLDIKTVAATVINAGKGSGPLVGGNLATLCHMLATPYAPNFKRCVVFLEDTGEKPYRIDRMLTQMQLAGCFDDIAALVLGDFTNCGSSLELNRILRDLFEGKPFPVISGLPAGHAMPNLTLPIGMTATVDTVSQRLRLSEAAVMFPDEAACC